jgi:hypothetical protein
MGAPKLDPRTADDFFADALTLASTYYCTDWLPSPRAAATANEIDVDPGLVLFRLFSWLAQYLVDIENAVPQHWQLAFYRFLDLRLRTAAPAFAPLQFTLVQTNAPQTVPRGTAVLHGQTQTIRFETDEELRVLPAVLSAALTLAPALDRYVDCANAWSNGNPGPLFLGQKREAEESPLPHWFVMGDAALFQPDPAIKSVSIELSGEHLKKDFFSRWYHYHNGQLAPLNATVEFTEDGRGLVVNFLSLPQSDQMTIVDLQTALCANAGFLVDEADVALGVSQQPTPLSWLLVRPADHVRVVPPLSDGYLPKIKTLACTVDAQGMLPQGAAYNSSLIDLTRGAFPFGKSPAVGDAFYLQCDNAFAHKNGQVTLAFKLTHVSNTYGTVIEWQYWGNTENAWVPFIKETGENAYGFKDGTDGMSRSGAISFTCPAIATQTVAGNVGYWIRAVIKSYESASGFNFQPLAPAIQGIPQKLLPDEYKQSVIDYLKQTAHANLLSSYQSVPPSNPPFIVSLRIDCRYTAEPTETWRHNAFTLEQLRVMPCMPYLPLQAEPSTLYLGFEYEAFVAECLGETLNLYVDIEGVRMGEPTAHSWQWLDAASGNPQWKRLEVEDSSAGFLRSGRIRFTVPASISDVVLFSKRACWFRVVGALSAKHIMANGIFPNTAAAYNLTTYTDVVIGSSTGAPDQTFLLPYAGVHETGPGETGEERNVGAQPDIQLQVLEPSAFEGKLGPELADRLRSIAWTCVDSFVGSGPTSRVYTLEARSGTITFGNGTFGMIPPAGSQNIVVKQFRTTHGAQGNVERGSLNILLSDIDGIAGVTNVVKAAGGVDGDTVADMVRRGPALLRANDRVITRSDLEVIAEAASARVCRAAAVERTIDSLSKVKAADDDATTIDAMPQMELVILAMADEPDVRTIPSLLEDVWTYVKARCPVYLQRRTTLRTPVFKPIDVAVTLKTTVPFPQWKSLRQDLVDRLTGFLHPVNGGPNGDGWRFGQPVQCSLVSNFLIGLTDLDLTAVGVLTLCGNPYQADLPADAVPCAGVIELKIEVG